MESGHYANASEVVRAGLMALHNPEEVRKVKLDALREAIVHGMNSGVAEGNAIAEVREHIRRRAAENTRKKATA